jgi:hypothetical protein
MGDIVNLHEYTDYCVSVEGVSGKMHTLSLYTIENLIDGRIKAEDIEGFQDMLPAILDNWLDLVEMLPVE